MRTSLFEGCEKPSCLEGCVNYSDLRDVRISRRDFQKMQQHLIAFLEHGHILRKALLP